MQRTGCVRAQGRGRVLTVSHGHHAARRLAGQVGRIGSSVVVRIAGRYPGDGDLETTGAGIVVACEAESVLPIIVLKRYAKAALFVNWREGFNPVEFVARVRATPQRRRKT